jgi:hypothetical protein
MPIKVINEYNRKIYEGLKLKGRRGSFARVAKEANTTRQNVYWAFINDSNNEIIAIAARIWKELAEKDKELSDAKKKAVQIAEKIDNSL